jgi:PPOX class probable F420-dependent enzyme
MTDGRPQVTPVWCDFDGTHIRINSAKGRVKDNNMRRNKKVALSIQDPDNPYRYLGVQGEIVEITEQGADDHIDALAKKYLGKDKYPFRAPGEVRVIYKIRPDKASTMG